MAPDAGFVGLDPGRQFLHCALAPAFGLDPAAEVLAGPPVEVDRLGMDGLESPAPGLLDEGKNILEAGLSLDLDLH
jgi:hypothetical protein